jgi:predicted enzyme related to lactoylglutathione lyase
MPPRCIPTANAGALDHNEFMDPARDRAKGRHMSFKNALASIAVRDIRTGIEWYQALLGKPPDSIPMSEVAEWKFDHGGWLQVYQSGDRAGGGSVTLAVDHLDDHAANLEKAGIGAGHRLASEKIRVIMIQDPDGNSVALAEAFDSEMAQ